MLVMENTIGHRLILPLTLFMIDYDITELA